MLFLAIWLEYEVVKLSGRRNGQHVSAAALSDACDTCVLYLSNTGSASFSAPNQLPAEVSGTTARLQCQIVFVEFM